MAEFTGERLIPGQVDVDLLNEHMARYTFAARLARGKRVLDAGCGAGYGSAELAQTALSVTALDVAHDAVDFARTHYTEANLHFEQASCTALPHRDASFDLVVAFEVIEHLENWRGLLEEARRVLGPCGQFIVSTPNKLYYTESRGEHGANPFHVHEFTFDEFCAELRAVFPHVSVFLENHVEGVTFQPHEAGHTVEARVDASEPVPDHSHFFVAVCAHRPQVGAPTFIYVPRAANVLRERERHITLLEGEIATKNAWLDKAVAEQESLMRQFADQARDLARSNEWAESLNAELKERRERILELQEQQEREQQASQRMADEYEAKIGGLERDIEEKIQWARSVENNLNAEIQKQTDALATTVKVLHETEKELEERTAWAMQLQDEANNLRERVNQLSHQLALVRGSRWMKLGRRVGLGPVLPPS